VTWFLSRGVFPGSENLAGYRSAVTRSQTFEVRCPARALREPGAGARPSAVYFFERLTMKDKDKVHGEGNYAASREYDEAARKFAQSGKVDRAARNAAPSSPQQAKDMERAEKIGKSRSKGEDPELDEGAEDEEALDQDLDDDIDSTDTRP